MRIFLSSLTLQSAVCTLLCSVRMSTVLPVLYSLYTALPGISLYSYNSLVWGKFGWFEGYFAFLGAIFGEFGIFMLIFGGNFAFFMGPFSISFDTDFLQEYKPLLPPGGGLYSLLMWLTLGSSLHALSDEWLAGPQTGWLQVFLLQQEMSIRIWCLSIIQT